MAVDFRIKPPLRDTEADARVAIPDNYRRYDDIYGYETLMNLTVEELLKNMKEFNVRDSVLQAEHEWGIDEEWNTRVASIVQAHPEAFRCGFGSVDPRRGPDALREIDRCYHELNLRGIVFEPGFLKLSPTDPICYPVYAKCVELGIPVGLHTGVNFSSHGPIRYGSPLYADEVACDFPDLTIICHHGGWPWPNESIAIAWKHPNVYLEFGAISPKYLAHNGGWGDMPHFMDTVLRSKVLFGSDWPMLQYGAALGDVEELHLRDASMSAYLEGNAQALLDRIL